MRFQVLARLLATGTMDARDQRTAAAPPKHNNLPPEESWKTRVVWDLVDQFRASGRPEGEFNKLVRDDTKKNLAKFVNEGKLGLHFSEVNELASFLFGKEAAGPEPAGNKSVLRVGDLVEFKTRDEKGKLVKMRGLIAAGSTKIIAFNGDQPMLLDIKPAYPKGQKKFAPGGIEFTKIVARARDDHA